MNKRIKQLAEQARAEVRADWAKGNKIPYPEAHYAFQRDNDQKFAELIVRECIDKIETYRIPVGNSAAGEMACEWTYNALKEIRDEIKEHFEVEK
jgi:hypothetical protein